MPGSGATLLHAVPLAIVAGHRTSQSRGLTQIKTALVDVRESLPIFLGSIGMENFDDDQAT
jgi:Kef-type K+ transport system membrane component KefB